jgi:hypothetical protein
MQNSGGYPSVELVVKIGIYCENNVMVANDATVKGVWLSSPQRKNFTRSRFRLPIIY